MNAPVGHVSKVDGANSLNDRIFEVMENIEYRRIVTPEDFESIGRLRASAFDARVVYAKKLGNNAVDEMDRAMHPHPTLSEAIAEGALSALGRAIHI